MPLPTHPNEPEVRFPKLRLVLCAAALLLLVACSGGKSGDASAEKAKDGKQTERTAEAGKKKDGDKKADSAIPVEVAQASRQDIAASYAGSASLAAPEETDVVAKTTGVLLQLNTEEGQTVKAGQLLAQIDPERTRLEVARASAALKKLEAEADRAKELFDRKLIAADAYEKLRYDVATQKAAVDLAKLELSYTRIEAPISGVISQRMVKRGNLIQLNQPLFHIVNTERLEAVLNVPERELATMNADLPVRMQVDAIPGRDFEGIVSRVSPVVDAGTGTVRVTTEFKSSGALRPGMFGRIEVIYDRRDDVLTVPRTALLEGEGEDAVFAVRDGKAVRLPVHLGYIDGSVAEIRDGLNEGDTVVTTGKVALRDGSKVQVLNPAAPVAELEDAGGGTAVANATGSAGASSR
ncbi:MAG: efflux RND transporter periplasmic adaptor subunit [Rhodanobacteraceae bacterium]|nr:efflux RND transporter periplasmic adaptor subunit [Xanthomonadales bacterium]MCP5478351.1 efflux RND transporter periplasmic adaptor subunit [Rhodanobacteraceae bacterium]